VLFTRSTLVCAAAVEHKQQTNTHTCVRVCVCVCVCVFECVSPNQCVCICICVRARACVCRRFFVSVCMSWLLPFPAPHSFLLSTPPGVWHAVYILPTQTVVDVQKSAAGRYLEDRKCKRPEDNTRAAIPVNGKKQKLLPATNQKAAATVVSVFVSLLHTHTHTQVCTSIYSPRTQSLVCLLVSLCVSSLALSLCYVFFCHFLSQSHA